MLKPTGSPVDDAQAPPDIHVIGATLRLKGVVLFDGLDLHLPAGSWTCLLGPSGSGKTTLLRLIAGLTPFEPPTRITARDGRPLADRVAWMGQQDLLLPWLTALENVTLGSRLRGERPDTVRAAHLLARVGLAGREHDRPAVLSGGMRQRVALARTLMEDRALVLMDEPFSALDAVTRLNLQDMAAELLRERTVLLVTHDPLEALRLGHRIFVLAERPARLSAALEPSGIPPRRVDSPDILSLQGELLRRLAADNRGSRG